MERYAIYWTAEPGPFAEFAAAWLGWDVEAGAPRPHPDVNGLPAPVPRLTETPRKYGFHGTVKPPFRLAPGTTETDLRAACAEICAGLAPVVLPGLQFHRIGGFLALTPQGDTAPLTALAAQVVRRFDRFRAPPTPEEIARRRPDRLSARQMQHLTDWGYPYVMDEFRFHLTLTGDIGAAEAQAVAEALRPRLGPLLPQPFRVAKLSLCGETAEGRFRVLHRYALTG